MIQHQYTEQQLREMALSHDINERRKAAEHNLTPEDVLQQLANDEHSYVRIHVAKNYACPIFLLRLLASNEDEYTRRGVAQNQHTPNDLLEKLAVDNDDGVRNRVAGNPSTSESLLRKLATDCDDWVRRNIAQNPASPMDVVLYCLSCSGQEIDGTIRKHEIQAAFHVHQDNLKTLARSGDLDFNMMCAGGETLKEGLISGGKTDIYNLLLAEQLTGKAERMKNCDVSPRHIPSRRI